LLSSLPLHRARGTA